MNPLAPTPELLQLTYRPDLEVLIGRWGYQPEPAALAAEYQRLEVVALECKSRRWLQDIRRRSLNDPETSRWLLDTFFPDMARRLGGKLRVAYLVGPVLHARILTEAAFLPPSAYENLPHAVAFFGDEGAALAWLQELA
ncbi:MAG: hypothetical protein ACRYFX_21255 [Janthinobacterium lividum]